MEDVYLKKIESLKNELHNTRRRLYITDRFLNKIGDLAGIQDNEPLTTKNGQSVEEYIAGALTETFREKFITPEVQAAIERDIPVQPKLITATREDFDDTFECPSCAKRFSSFDEFDFCPWCGQRLDWGKSC
ncbi:hypothetical protein [Oxalobacter formigenes]